MRIMYLEDNQSNALFIQRVINAGQHEFFNYIDGESALAHYNHVDPDVILVDIQLAGKMNGVDFIYTVREAGISVPIVVITAFANESEQDLYLDAGANYFIVKPVSPEGLLDLLEAQL